jgi:hypothetical protein
LDELELASKGLSDSQKKIFGQRVRRMIESPQKLCMLLGSDVKFRNGLAMTSGHGSDYAPESYLKEMEKLIKVKVGFFC